ncbi:hypothetical protein KCP71_23545 [Salmonella enterica subsp. enterica]|nr:hypothetical protein KCP71_23545 [Salmonella enterica subsp. enterica]
MRPPAPSLPDTCRHRTPLPRRTDKRVDFVYQTGSKQLHRNPAAVPIPNVITPSSNARARAAGLVPPPPAAPTDSLRKMSILISLFWHVSPVTPHHCFRASTPPKQNIPSSGAASGSSKAVRAEQHHRKRRPAYRTAQFTMRDFCALSLVMRA